VNDDRARGGAALLATGLLVAVFLAQADYGGIGAHPGRVVILVLLVTAALAAFFFGVRLVRQALRDRRAAKP
jgi:hypothetical protein